MRELRVGAGRSTPPARLIIEDRGYDNRTGRDVFDQDARLIREALVRHLPVGTLYRLVQLLLDQEIRQHQEQGRWDVAERLMAAREVYAAQR